MTIAIYQTDIIMFKYILKFGQYGHIDVYIIFRREVVLVIKVEFDLILLRLQHFKKYLGIKDWILSRIHFTVYILVVYYKMYSVVRT